MKQTNFWSRVVGVAAGLIYIVFGMLMIQNPNTTLKTLSFMMAWIVLVSGVLALIISYMTRRFSEEIHQGSLFDGIILLVLGLIFMFGNFISNTLFLAYMLLFWIIIDSALQLQFAAFIPKHGLRILVMVLDILIIAYGVWLLFNPGLAEGFLVLYTGFAFISTGVSKMIKVV